MSLNIKDRKDFYAKLDSYFAQLSDNTNNSGIYDAAMELFLNWIQTYVNSKQGQKDYYLKELLYVILQSLLVDTHKNIDNKTKLEHISGYIEKIRTAIRKETDPEEKEERTIKSGAESMFMRFEALASIGDSEQYSQHLDSVFPDSEIKDIMYYGSKTRKVVFNEKLLGTFTEDDDVGAGFYFNTKLSVNKSRNVIPVILNVTNPLIDFRYHIFDFGNRLNKVWVKSDEIEIHKEQIYIENDFEREFVRRVLYKIGDRKKISNIDLSMIFSIVIQSFGFDSLKYSNMFNNKKIVVFHPSQVHVLGSKKDLELFKQFVDRQKSNIRTSLTA